mmetsp:Transcript_17244/g.26021  ORF Transcript_17244/g.26021 Transcript_17244/m.26021 type:complete len:152 (-) Transcript_17244:250-705(-)
MIPDPTIVNNSKTTKVGSVTVTVTVAATVIWGLLAAATQAATQAAAAAAAAALPLWPSSRRREIPCFSESLEHFSTCCGCWSVAMDLLMGGASALLGLQPLHLMLVARLIAMKQLEMGLQLWVGGVVWVKMMIPAGWHHWQSCLKQLALAW